MTADHLDILVLVLFLLVTIAGFMWRRTRVQAYYYAWLALSQLEMWARADRDRKSTKDQRHI